MSLKRAPLATFCLALCVASGAQDPSLDAPASAPAGSEIEIGWAGQASDRDFVTIVAPDAPESTYSDYQYTRDRGSVTLRVPEEPGDYEIRYLAADSPHATLARRALEVTAVSASLTAPDSARAGAEIEITWTGPDNRQDFVTIVEAGAAERSYDDYQYTNRGNPLTLKAPDEPGAYELRYLTGATYRTLARHAVTVTATSATLTAPDSVAAGAPFDVSWTGPDNQNDFVTIVPAGSKDDAYDDYQYTRGGPVLTLRAPDAPGDYELRYLTGASSRKLASRPIVVTGTAAALSAPEQAVAGGKIEVGWEGPDHPQDYVLIVAAAAGDDAYDSYAYTERGNPATIVVPPFRSISSST